MCIPKGVREDMHWTAGQAFAFIPEGKPMGAMPTPRPQPLRGIAKGTHAGCVTDRIGREPLTAVCEGHFGVGRMADERPGGEKIGACFPSPAHGIAPTIVQPERAQSMVREVGEDEADPVVRYTQTGQVPALETRLALLAASLRRELNLATANPIVCATALLTGARLITCEAHFSKRPLVICVGKS